MRITAKILHRMEYNGFVQSIFLVRFFRLREQDPFHAQNKKSITMRHYDNT